MSTILNTLNREFDLADDPEILNGSILETIKTIDRSILSVGLGLAIIKTGKLYKRLGFKNMSAYVFYLIAETKRNRSSIYKWLQIGEIYIKYREKLEEIGFSGKDSPTKLPYLERALRIKPQKEVYDNIIDMTQREFADYARSIATIRDESPEIPEEDALESVETMDGWGYSFYYRDKEAVRVSKNLRPSILNKLRSCIRLAFNSLDRNSYVIAVHLDNHREYRRFTTIALEAREKMRLEMRQRVREDMSGKM